MLVTGFRKHKSRARHVTSPAFYLIGEELPLTTVSAMGHSENNNTDDRKRRNGNRGHRDNEAFHAVVGLRDSIALLCLVDSCLIALRSVRHRLRSSSIGLIAQCLSEAQGIAVALLFVLSNAGIILMRSIGRAATRRLPLSSQGAILGCVARCIAARIDGRTIASACFGRCIRTARSILVRMRNTIRARIQGIARNSKRRNKWNHIHDRGARRR